MTKTVENRRTFENTYVRYIDPKRILKELRQMYLVRNSEDWSGAWQYAGNYAVLDDNGEIVGTLYSEIIGYNLEYNCGKIINGSGLSVIPVPRLKRCLVGRRKTVAKAMGDRSSYNDRLRQNASEVRAWFNKILPPPQE